MGKIRVATLGNSEDEKKHRDEARKRRDQKRAVKAGIAVEEVKEVKKTSVTKKTNKRIRSDHYQTLRKKVDDRTYYSFTDALALVKQTSRTSFVGSVEAHFNLSRVVKIKNNDSVKAERKMPLAHAKLGKTSDTDAQLLEKLEQTIKILGKSNIKKLVIHASMGPGIKVTLPG